MNEFVAKKLGEVLAFTDVFTETFEKGRGAIVSVFGEEYVKTAENKMALWDKVLRKIVEDEGVKDIVLKKLEGTGTKLRSMRDLYVGDQWENPTELMEWSGFFEGAAIVHWQLVKGAGEAISHTELIGLAKENLNFHCELLERAKTFLHAIGKSKAV